MTDTTHSTPDLLGGGGGTETGTEYVRITDLIGALIWVAPIATEPKEYTLDGVTEERDALVCRVLQVPTTGDPVVDAAVIDHGELFIFWEHVARQLRGRVSSEQPWTLCRIHAPGERGMRRAYSVRGSSPDELAHARPLLATWQEAEKSAQEATDSAEPF